MKKTGISPLSRVLSALAGIALVISLFVPMWRIELDAPQYPEGLALQIFPHKLGGDVAIINGLNHYIGMQTLHAENFVEFTVLPYIIAAFAIAALLAAAMGKRKLLQMVFFAFVIFGVVAMIDFWRWEYDYGHNLDPNAAIIVPGMAYQPPLIGFKQLLNFGAFSIPDTGGWLFITAGALLLVAVLKEAGVFNRFFNKKIAGATVLLLLLQSCSSNEPEAIAYNRDNCSHCKMTITDSRFAAEVKTTKGRVYKFDDITCMTAYLREHNDVTFSGLWVSNFDGPQQLIDATTAYYIQDESFNSPMRGNTAAFTSKEAAGAIATKLQAAVTIWDSVSKSE